MPENRKLPFLDTKISLFDLQNLEKKGFFRSIFIELLKADKIKNVIPNELQINQTKQELCLKYNIEQLKNKKDNEFLIHNLKLNQKYHNFLIHPLIYNFHLVFLK